MQLVVFPFSLCEVTYFCVSFSSEVWCIQLNDSVIDIAHLPEGKVFASLADGSIAVLQV